MTQAWIIFKIGNQNVYQIRYNGCTGQDVIDDYKGMIAQEYKVSEDDVKVMIDDLILKTKIVSSELARNTREALGKKELKN
ncbi:MAG: hypothetical protein AABY15_06925 [Nanoarchaeota archaeon]